jgi:hypothetical protein
MNEVDVEYVEGHRHSPVDFNRYAISVQTAQNSEERKQASTA